ncbi:MAG: SRPBCC domain-containing protein [Acidobacteriota bacterium]|nr:SRPBCC domain-containing protein [Acidobacteriota bacterium]
MPELNEFLDREITMCARRETVFRYFTDSERFAKWWGAGSQIDPRPGGAVTIRYPNAVTVTGEVKEIDPPRRIVFTYAYAGNIPADGSLVTITLDETLEGTVLKLRHAFSSAKIRDTHVQGWRYQLALFSKTVAEDQHSGAAERIDEFLRAWGEPDAAMRRSLAESCLTPEISFRDAFSATDGLEEMLANLEAVQIFMPGMTLTRAGDVRQAHGTAIAGWTASAADGSPRGSGTNVFDLAPDGRIRRVVGFWGG